MAEAKPLIRVAGVLIKTAFNESAIARYPTIKTRARNVDI